MSNKKLISISEVLKEMWDNCMVWYDLVNLKKVEWGTEITMGAEWNMVTPIEFWVTLPILITCSREKFLKAVETIKNRLL